MRRTFQQRFITDKFPVGMGNRFFTLTGYHPVVKAHGILAAITFLLCVPAAILIMRFGGRRPQLARKLHIWLQILTLFLSTAVLILGVFAVGPARSLTNPHHGIGVAIYTLIWVQILGGCLVYRSEKKHRRIHIPLKAMLHHWLGRAIALLGIAQVALGLTLYGSPLYLFVLYALWVFGLLVLYFILQWLHEKRKSSYQSQHGSYIEEEVSQRDNRKHSGLAKLAVAGTAGAGLAALFRRRSSGNRQNQNQNQSDLDGTESGTSYMYDEKESDTSRKGLGRKLLGIGAIGGGIYAIKNLFGKKRNTDNESDVGPYRPPLGGNQSVVTDSMSRIEEGRPPNRPMTPVGASPGYARASHPLAQPPMTPGSGRRPSNDSYSYYSYMSGSPSRRGRHQTFREAAAAGGTMFAVRQLFKNRRQKKEERRAADLRNQRVNDEHVQRINSVHGYTGDGVLPPSRRARQERMNSQTASDLSSMIDGSVQPTGPGPIRPVAGPGLAAASAMADRDRVRPAGYDPVVSLPGPPTAAASNLPPPPPPHGIDPQSSGSELYTTTSGQQRHRHHLRDDAAAGLAGAAAGGLAADTARRRHSGRQTDSLESPPVSLKVKMHNDGRHVTLRRLTEEEAAAQREARRRERRASASRRQRTSSLSSSSGGEAFGTGSSADRRWRRTEALEAQQAAENEAAGAAVSVSPMPAASTSGPIYPVPPPPGTQQAIDPHTGRVYQLPRPPPIPASTSNLGPAGSITSPGTETSGATEYANNRRRRRAERAQAKMAREGRNGGNTVDFT